jgi:hypothetical protein
VGSHTSDDHALAGVEGLPDGVADARILAHASFDVGLQAGLGLGVEFEGQRLAAIFEDTVRAGAGDLVQRADGCGRLRARGIRGRA